MWYIFRSLTNLSFSNTESGPLLKLAFPFGGFSLIIRNDRILHTGLGSLCLPDLDDFDVNSFRSPPAIFQSEYLSPLLNGEYRVS